MRLTLAREALEKLEAEYTPTEAFAKGVKETREAIEEALGHSAALRESYAEAFVRRLDARVGFAAPQAHGRRKTPKSIDEINLTGTSVGSTESPDPYRLRDALGIGDPDDEDAVPSVELDLARFVSRDPVTAAEFARRCFALALDVARASLASVPVRVAVFDPFADAERAVGAAEAEAWSAMTR